jgi:hypothetical protein
VPQAALAIKPAAITLYHRKCHERIDVGPAVEVVAADPASDDRSVSCGIPGDDRPGAEVHAQLLSVRESGMELGYSGVCGFTTTFDYRSDT